MSDSFQPSDYVSGTISFSEKPWFPFCINLPTNIVITLLADGKWKGSVHALREYLATAKSIGGDGTIRVLLWLILREMEHDQCQK